MAQKPAEERSVRDLRAALADVLNGATVRDQITYVTSRGRRIAAVVPVPVAEAAEGDPQADADAHTAWTLAVNCVMREEKPPAGQTAAEVFDSYAADLVDELGGDRDRLYAAARVACIKAADEVAHPGRWRSAIRAVELCIAAARTTEKASAPSA